MNLKVFDSAFFILYAEEIRANRIPLTVKIILPEKNGFCRDGLKSGVAKRMGPSCRSHRDHRVRWPRSGREPACDWGRWRIREKPQRSQCALL